MGVVRTIGVEEELLVVDDAGVPVPKGPEALEVARPAGDERLVDEGLAALLRRGTGADLQRRVHRETGDPAAVVRAAVAITADGSAGRAVPRSTD